MKKILVTLVATGIGLAVQAASFDWKTGLSGEIYQAGTTAKIASGTAYIFDSAAVTQQAVLTAFLTDSTWTAGALHSKTVTTGAIAATGAEAFTWSNGTSLTAFIAIVDGDNIYISPTANKAALETGYSQFSFSAKATSQLAAMESTTFTTAGWYATSSPIPEPTSGLLILLGMAGLALKRKRA